ncbi:ABC transporter permease [Rhodoplanes sp. TEM]|uniref:ABC transporter permease n=1 Tax=Rhodoplanes tepidamans TaxID=200616 RepID=A0ABT5JA18_RHOTP|nr:MULTISPECIES: ABC transporter permease [Rhodoplanes]MDC7786322.1 ABC transporter permease [Rhodoplanes tepidamans]MDC7984719.1 ABC transporter permease [Rhodoplanes sp. TEM]MDQ0354065.1 ABC-type nitrate/sulfonate/bicarbonate transport system permease component [Rhodoplanes tepidamans]
MSDATVSLDRPSPALRAGRNLALVVLTVGVLVLAWQLIVVGLKIPPYLVPPPGPVAQAFVANIGVIGTQTAFTLTAAALGLAVSTVLATGIALAFSMSRNLAQASLPVVIAFRSTPVAAVAPLAMLFLGRGISTSMAVVTIVSFFPLLVNLMRGLAGADRNAAELMHVYGASRWQQMRYVRIPYALPFLFTGMRIAASSAILGAMLSEWITGSKGLGNLILDSGEMRETELLWAAVVTSVTIAMSVFWLTSAGEKRFVHWRA